LSLIFLKETDYIKAKEKLAMESFKLSELISKGYGDYIPGLITLKDYFPAQNNFSNNFSNKKVDILNDNDYTKLLITYNAHNYVGYTYKKILTNNSTKILPENTTRGMYVIDFNSTIQTEYKSSHLSNPSYQNYQRLVYVK
jgi:hypothetical protein